MRPIPGIDFYASEADMAEYFGTEEERAAEAERANTTPCTLCFPGPDVTDEDCDKWPGHFKGCMYEAEGCKPINGWKCDGKGNLTRAAAEDCEGREKC